MKQKLLLFLGCMLMVMGMRAEEVTKSVTFSEYTAGSQYAENEKHDLGDGLVIYTTKCHFTSQLRIYSSSTNNGFVISGPLPGAIVSMGFNAGYKVDVLNVYGSTDGKEWTLVKGVEVTSTSYKDYTAQFPEESAYKCFKLDVKGTNQIRIAKMSVTYISSGEAPSAPSKPKFEPSSCSFLETKKVTISCSTDGATIYYTTDGLEPTQDDEVYSSPLEITTTTTVKAIAVNENGASEKAEATYTKVEAMSIAEAKKAYDEADNTEVEVFINLENAVVTVNEGDYLFIQDGTAGINLYRSGATYAAGTKFTEGVLSGISTAYKEMHQITNAEFTDVETTTVEVAPIAVTVAQLKADYATYEGRYVKLTDVELAGTTITQGKDSYVAYDRFGWGFAAEYSTPTVCDIEGAVACYETTLQIFPVVITVKEAVLPQVSPAGGELSEEALTVEQGTEIMIVPAENNTVTYSINEAEAIAIAEATTITAENLGVMKLVVTSTFGGSSKTATYYYNVVAATPKITATLTTGEINDATNVSSYRNTASVRSKTGVWSGYMMVNKSGGYLQINYNEKGFHIQSPVFPGKIVSVAITFTKDTPTPRTFVIMPSEYDGTTANESSDGCLGAATYDGTNETVTATLSGDVNSFKIFSTKGVIYISSIQVVYEKPADHVLSVGGTGWATLYLGLDAKIPEGVTCYRVTAVENGVATLKETRVVNGETVGLPAHTAVIVKAEPHTDYTFEYNSSYNYSIVKDNLLMGTITDEHIVVSKNENCYVLSQPEGKEVGLYKAALTDDKFLNNASKAYLPVVATSTASSNGYRFNIEGTTAIAPSIFDTPQSTAIYDLTGRRVEKMEKGIYIVNGKKVIR